MNTVAMAINREGPMYVVEVDTVLHFVPPMSDHGHGIRLTRTIELPFPPAHDIAVFSQDWEGLCDMDQPMGYFLKEITWDVDRKRFLADTLMSVTGVPIAMIPLEILRLVHNGWSYGSYRDSYRTKHRRGRTRSKPQPIPVHDWDETEAEKWEENPKHRPKEFKVVLHAVVATMAELFNNCGVAYAMLKTGMYFDVPEGKPPSELSHHARRFAEAVREYEMMPFDNQWNWCQRVKRRYLQLSDIIPAIR